eukprot:TRINITY_DN4164_c0_g1_i2.p1 TRINITY_DN4164_c0_g1~~TRINITY_DN4164_c0_g1_i2.p1  ORF type:complete len:115 (+),score=22.28 TRINITY_DN4164_c0_g1_i2:277-621(+)
MLFWDILGWWKVILLVAVRFHFRFFLILHLLVVPLSTLLPFPFPDHSVRRFFTFSSSSSSPSPSSLSLFHLLSFLPFRRSSNSLSYNPNHFTTLNTTSNGNSFHLIPSHSPSSY